MQTFHCRYRDVKHPWQIREDVVRASDETGAFKQFIQRRKKDHWTMAQIFVQSQIQLISEENNEVFILDSFGEVKQPHTTIPG